MKFEGGQVSCLPAFVPIFEDEASVKPRTLFDRLASRKISESGFNARHNLQPLDYFLKRIIRTDVSVAIIKFPSNSLA